MEHISILLEVIKGLIEVIREDPRIGAALAILLVAGVAAAILIRKFRRRAEFTSIRQ